MVTIESKIVIPQDVIFRDVAGEAVILNLETGKYYGLDEVGTRMWALLAEHGKVETAYRALLDEYEVAPEQLQDDLIKLIDTLAAQQLLKIDEA